MRQVSEHIIHCSDSTFGDVKAIRHWHVARGFKDVGYHFVIRQDGEVEMGRPLHEIGAHCAGHNQQSIGTCLIGKENFTVPQLEALSRLHSMLKTLFPCIKAVPHYAYNSQKSCPNFNPAPLNFNKKVVL